MLKALIAMRAAPLVVVHGEVVQSIVVRPLIGVVEYTVRPHAPSVYVIVIIGMEAQVESVG